MAMETSVSTYLQRYPLAAMMWKALAKVAFFRFIYINKINQRGKTMTKTNKSSKILPWIVTIWTSFSGAWILGAQANPVYALDPTIFGLTVVYTGCVLALSIKNIRE